MSRSATGTASPRDRLLDAATTLFSEEGIQVGINRIIARADVALMTLYRHFESKDKLLAAALEQWGAEWLRALHERIDRQGDDPELRVAALWDALEEWFATEGFRGSFVANVATELGSDSDHPAQAVIAAHRMALRQLLEDLAKGAGAREAAELAAELQLLLDGAVAMAAVDHRPTIVASARALADAAIAAASR